MLTPKTSDFRPAYRNQVYFDHPHEKQINRSTLQNRVFFGPQFQSTQEKQMIIDPHTKTKSISTPRTKIKSVSIPTPEPSRFRSPTQKPS